MVEAGSLKEKNVQLEMISDIFSFLLSKAAIFFENLGVILKISGARATKRTYDFKISFMGWITFSFMEIFYKSRPPSKLQTMAEGGICSDITG